MVSITSSVLDAQAPLAIVHLSVLVLPMERELRAVVKELMLVMLAVPVITLQVPVPMVGRLPSRIAVVVLQIA